MFTKLIKHNLKPIFKSILPFILAFTISVIAFTITAYESQYIYESLPDGKVNLVEIIEPPQIQLFLHGLFNFTTSCSLILLFAATVRVIWKRFKSNFYSDEAYLTHTLPISRHMLWNAHCCSMLITFASVIIVLALNCILLATTRSGAQLLESFGLIGGTPNGVGQYFSVKALSPTLYISYATLVFIELTFITICGMTGTILKNRFHKNIALLSGIGLYVLGSIILLTLYYIVDLIVPNSFNVFGSYPGTIGFGQEINYGPITRAIFYISLVYLCYCTTLYFIDRKILQKGIDLE